MQDVAYLSKWFNVTRLPLSSLPFPEIWLISGDDDACELQNKFACSSCVLLCGFLSDAFQGCIIRLLLLDVLISQIAGRGVHT